MKRKKRRRMKRRRLTLPVWERKGGAQLFWSWFGSTRVETPDVFNTICTEYTILILDWSFIYYISNIYISIISDSF